ncbi:hypothetical protein Tco_0236690, partial [Tanacetum coccineum]
MRTRSQTRNRNRQQQAQQAVVQPFHLEEPFVNPPLVPMADNRTMTQLLQAPTEGYGDAIVIPEINANFELKHGLINLVQNKQFFGHDKEDPHAHIRYFNKITSTMRFPNVPSTSIKLMLFSFSLEVYETPPQQMQGVSKTDFENYVKANDAVLRNMQNQGQGTLPSQTVTNPREHVNAITTRSGKTCEGPSTPLVPTPIVSTPLKEPEQNPETSMDKAKKTVNIEIQKPNSLEPNSYQPKLPYPERMKIRENDKPSAQHSRFLKMFKQLRLEIGLKDSFLSNGRRHKWLSSLLRNKEKLEVNRHYPIVNDEYEQFVALPLMIPIALPPSFFVKTSDNLEENFTSSNVNNEMVEDVENENSNVSNSDEPVFLNTPLTDKVECFDSEDNIDEIDAFLAMEVSSNFEEGYYDSEGDVIFLENLLSDDTTHNLAPEVIFDHEPKQNESIHNTSITFSPRSDPLHHEFAGEIITLPSRIAREHEEYLSLMTLLCEISTSLKGSRSGEDGFKAHLQHLWSRSEETFTGTMFLYMDQLQKQLDNEEFQEIESMSTFKKSIGERAHIKWEFERKVNEKTIQKTDGKADTSNASGALDARQQHYWQQNSINQGKVVHGHVNNVYDTCPLPAKLIDDKTIELLNQLLESENVLRGEFARVSNDLSKPVTTYYLPKRRESAPAKPHYMIATSSSRYSSNDIVHNHYLEEAKKKAQEHSRNSRNFSDSKHFVCSTCQKCVFNANHDSCVIKFLKEVNSRAKVPSNKTITRNKPVEQTRFAKKPERQIPKGHRFSIKNTSVVHKKTMTPRSCLKWKPTGRVFKNVVLRWVPTGKTFASSTTKVDSEPPNGSNADITNQCESEQALDVSAADQASVFMAMMSDHNSSDLAPQRQEMSVENVASGLVPQGQK